MRRILLGLIALAFCLSCLGCSGPSAPAATAAPATAAPATAAPSAPAAAATAEPAPTPSPTPSLVELHNPYRLTFLGEDLTPAEEAGGVGVEAAIQRVLKRHGTGRLGKECHYTCIGLAESDEALYYTIYWTQTDQEDPDAAEEYQGHLYVSLDGEELLEGDGEYIHPQVGG